MMSAKHGAAPLDLEQQKAIDDIGYEWNKGGHISHRDIGIAIGVIAKLRAEVDRLQRDTAGKARVIHELMAELDLRIERSLRAMIAERDMEIERLRAENESLKALRDADRSE